MGKRNSYSVLMGKPERNRSLDPCIDWRIILIWILKVIPEGVDLSIWASDRRQWRAVVNTAMDLFVP